MSGLLYCVLVFIGLIVDFIFIIDCENLMVDEVNEVYKKVVVEGCLVGYL